MSRKSKKKEVHRHPEEHPLITKSRERRDIEAKKKAGRLLKMEKSKRRSTTPDAATSCHETSVEENVSVENTDRSLSSTPQPSSSSDEVEQWSHIFDSNYKSKKKTKVVRTSERKPTIADQTDGSESQKTITETSSAAGLTRTSMRKKSFLATGPEVPKLQKKTTEFGQFKSTDTKTGQVFSKSAPVNYLGDTRLPKDETKIPSGLRKQDFNRKMKESETLTTQNTIKHRETTQSNLQKVPLKASPEEFPIKKEAVQKKLEQIGTEKKCSVEKDNQHKTKTMIGVPKNPTSSISGYINVFDLKTPYESSEEECQIYSLRYSDIKILEVKENNVQICIVVFGGTQVICNRMQQTVDWASLEKNLKSRPGTFKGQTTLTLDKDVRSVSEKVDETLLNPSNLDSRPGRFEGQTTVTLEKDVRSVSEKVDETLLNPSNLDRDNFEPCLQTVEDQAATKSHKDVKSDPGHNDKTTDVSSNLRQNSLESFPQTLKDETTVKSDPFVSLQQEHNYAKAMDSITPGLKDADLCTQTLESQTTVTSNEEVKYEEQPDEFSANSSNLDQESAKLYPQASEAQSTITSGNDVGFDSKQHDKTPDLSNFGQDDAKICPQPLESEVKVALKKNVISGLEKHDETLIDLNNLSQDNVESCSQSMEGQATGKVVRSDLTQPEETSVDSSNLGNVDVETCAQTLGHSTFASDKEVGSVPVMLEETPLISINLDQDDGKSCLPTLEDESIIASDKNVMTATEKHDETPTNLSNMNQNAVESCLLTTEGESTVASDEDIWTDLEKPDETTTNPSNSENLSVRKIPSENVSSELKSLEENIQRACNDFLESCSSVCESFVEKVMDSFRAKKK